MEIIIKDIPGWEGKYKATSDGRILNAKTLLPVKPTLHKYGYLRLKLGIQKKQYTVHRLIALTFLGESVLEVNHKDGNKLNNNIDNLEYLSKRDNLKHACKNGFHSSFKLNDKQVEVIKDRYISGEKLKDLAIEFNVTATAIRKRLEAIGVEFRKWKNSDNGKDKKRENKESNIYKIHPDKYPEIERLFFNDKLTQIEICEKYSVSLSCIKRIIRELKLKR